MIRVFVNYKDVLRQIAGNVLKNFIHDDRPPQDVYLWVLFFGADRF